MILVSVSFGIFIGGSSAVSLSDHMVFGVFGGIVIFMAWRNRQKAKGEEAFSDGEAGGFLRWVIFLFLMVCILVDVWFCTGVDCLISDLYMYGGFAFGAAAALFGGSLFHFSAYRNALWKELSGFRKFIWKGDKGTLERLLISDPRTTIIRIFPYAVALGLTARWEKNFRPDPGNTQPFWYKVDEDDPFSARYMDRWISEGLLPPLPDRQQERRCRKNRLLHLRFLRQLRCFLRQRRWRRRSWKLVGGFINKYLVKALCQC